MTDLIQIIGETSITDRHPRDGSSNRLHFLLSGVELHN